MTFSWVMGALRLVKHESHGKRDENIKGIENSTREARGKIFRSGWKHFCSVFVVLVINRRHHITTIGQWLLAEDRTWENETIAIQYNAGVSISFNA